MKTTAVHTHIEGLSSGNATVKYSSVRQLLVTADEHPEHLYPHLDFFAKLLHSDNQILRWTAIDVVGSVARIDREDKLRELMKPLINLLKSGELITANHAIGTLGAIAEAKPQYRAKITTELLHAEGYKFESEECRNIVLGKIMLAFESYLETIPRNSKILKFVQRQTMNPSSATKEKAEKLLKKK